MKWDGVEKRRFVRANFPCKVIIRTPTQHLINTHTENIGAGGVRIIIGEKLDVSSMVGLEIYLDKDSVKCEGKIVWMVERVSSAENEPFLFDTGIEFYDINDDDRNLITNLVEMIVSGKK